MPRSSRQYSHHSRLPYHRILLPKIALRLETAKSILISKPFTIPPPPEYIQCSSEPSNSPPVQIPQNHILASLDIHLHLHIHRLAPGRDLRMREVPRPVALGEQVADSVVRLLLRETVLAEEVDDVVVDAHGLLFVEGEDVVLSVLSLF